MKFHCKLTILIDSIIFALLHIRNAEAYERCEPQPDCWTNGIECAPDLLVRDCNGAFCQTVCHGFPTTTTTKAAGNGVNTFISTALKFQGRLQERHLPITQMQLMGTHNSFISNAYGIGLEESQSQRLFRDAGGFKRTRTVIANQRLSVTMQLQLGVRHLEVDTHLMMAVTGDNIKLCHWDVCPPDYALLIEFLSTTRSSVSPNHLLHKLRNQMDNNNDDYGLLKWNPLRVGCWHGSMSLRAGLSEIQTFLQANPDEFIILYFDNRIRRRHIMKFLDVLIVSAFGSGGVFPLTSVFTPRQLREKFSDSMPCKRALVDAGYRVMFELYDQKHWLSPESGQNVEDDKLTLIARDLLFNRDSLWSEFMVDRFNADDCSIGGVPLDDLGIPVRALDASLSLGPLKHFNDSEPAIIGRALRQMTDCGVHRVALDQLTPNLALNAVWTFAEGTSVDSIQMLMDNNSLHDVAVVYLDKSSKRWHILSGLSNQTAPSYASCRSFETRKVFISADSCRYSPSPRLVRQQMPCQNNICGDKGFLDPPRTAVENHQLIEEMTRRQLTRISVTSNNINL